jgi:hypothetical protein
VLTSSLDIRTCYGRRRSSFCIGQHTIDAFLVFDRMSGRISSHTHYLEVTHGDHLIIG